MAFSEACWDFNSNNSNNNNDDNNKKIYDNNINIERHNLRFFTIFSLHIELLAICTLRWPGHVHVQVTCKHIRLLSHTTCRMPCNRKGQGLTELKSHSYCLISLAETTYRDADFLLFSVFFPLFLARSVLLFHLPLSELSVSFCVHFCETARTRRFSVIFATVQWHPCTY